jgi:hypothetical protein
MKENAPIGLKVLERSTATQENKTDYQQLIVTGSVAFLSFILLVWAFGLPKTSHKMEEIKVPVYTAEQVKAREQALKSQAVAPPEAEIINNYTEQEAVKIVGELVRKGIVLEVNPGSYDVMVDSRLWSLLDFRAKEGVAYVLSAFMAFGPGGGDIVNIIDGSTGKKIGEKRYDGFKTL